MEHLYVVTKGNDARLYQAVTDELDNGRYHMYDFLKENVRHRTYNSIEEVEEMFDGYVKSGIIDSWHRLQISESTTLL